MALIGGVLVVLLPLVTDTTRDSIRASRHAEVLAIRWETVRRFRADAAQATQAKVLRGVDAGVRGAELTGRYGSVIWAERDGLLHRAASPGPVVQGAPVTARFGVERRGGRTWLSYEFADDLGRVAGSVLVGSAPPAAGGSS